MKMKTFLRAALSLTAALAVQTSGRADQISVPAAFASGVSNATVATTGAAYTVVRDKDLGFWFSQTAANGGTSNSVYGFNFQIGTNWTTTLPWSVTVTNNGTNPVAAYVTLPRTNLVGVNAIRWDQFSTPQTNLVTPSTITVDWNH